MPSSIPEDAVRRFDDMVRSEAELDWDWFQDTLASYPELARRPLSDGRLPLRAILDAEAQPGYFSLLLEHGAQHDLFTASAACDPAAVQRLLAADPSHIYDRDTVGNTPLHWAATARYGDTGALRPETTRLLLEAGADPDAVNDYGETPLDCAVLHGGGNAVESLLEHDAALTPRFAVADEAYELLEELLITDPDALTWINPRDGETLLHLAVLQDCGARMIHWLLDHGVAPLIDAQSHRGTTALLQAMQQKAFDEAEALVERGADPNISRHGKRWSIGPLDFALQHDRIHLMASLLERGARAFNKQHEHMLCYVRSGEMADLLIARGFDPRQPNHHGRTPLDIAVEEGRRDVVAALLAHGIEPTIYVHVVLGDIAQATECLDRRPELLTALNQAGSLPEPSKEATIEMCWGSVNGTALHYATKGGSLAMVKFLLTRGADPNAPTAGGWTPLHDAVYYAIYNDLREGQAITRLLLDSGASLASSTPGGLTPRGVAEYFLEMPRYEDAAQQFIKLLDSVSGEG